MYFYSPPWIFSLVRGELYIISFRHCGQWAFREFDVRQLCTFGGGGGGGGRMGRGAIRRTFTKRTQCHLAAGVS